MIETTTNPRVREGFRHAHEERAQVVRDAWAWLTGRGK